MSPYSKCPTCGASNFTPRLDVDSDAMEERLADPSACPEIEETLSLLEEDYENCASEIARLQLQIQILSSRQQKSKACKSKLQSLLSPCSVQKLPTEILMSIFDLVSHDNRMRESPNLNSSRLWANSEDGPAAMPALVVSSVCSRWRELALAYPAIWSRISLILDAKGTNESFAVTVKLYIERSGSSLLRLRIDTPSSFFKGLSTPHPVLSLIGLHSNRWQQLTFVGANYFSREIFSIPANVHQFPVLEALELDFCSRESLEVFGQAPCLRSLCVSYLVIELRSNFPWKQLTSLDVACKGRMDGLAYFCPNITSLQLRLDHFAPFPEIATPPRVFPALQSLSVIITDILEEANLLDIVFSSFICPSLTSLTLEGSVLSYATWSLHSLESFLSRSSCALTNLSIRGLQLRENNLVTILHCLPSLTSLTVQDHYSGMQISKTITPALIQSLNTSSTPLLPKLRHLSLTYVGKVFDDVGLVDMVQSRCLSNADARTGINSLRSLVLISWDRTPASFEEVAEIYEPLNRLEETGFRLVLRFINGS